MITADTISLSETQASLAALRSEGGAKATASLTIEPNSIQVYFRPMGWDSGQPFIFGQGDTIAASIAHAREQWNEMRERVQNETVKTIALAIIRITHEQGCCTDASLRADFDAGDVDKYKADAVSLANSMADNGPFEVIELDRTIAA